MGSWLTACAGLGRLPTLANSPTERLYTATCLMIGQGTLLSSVSVWEELPWSMNNLFPTGDASSTIAQMKNAKANKKQIRTPPKGDAAARRRGDAAIRGCYHVR